MSTFSQFFFSLSNSWMSHLKSPMSYLYCLFFCEAVFKVWESCWYMSSLGFLFQARWQVYHLSSLLWSLLNPLLQAILSLPLSLILLFLLSVIHLLFLAILVIQLEFVYSNLLLLRLLYHQAEYLLVNCLTLCAYHYSSLHYQCLLCFIYFHLWKLTLIDSFLHFLL